MTNVSAILSLPTHHDLPAPPNEETVKVAITENGVTTYRMECELCEKMFNVTKKEFALAGFVCDECAADQADLRF